MISKIQHAIETPYDNLVSGLTAEDVQAAIDELSGFVTGGTPNTLAYFNASGDLDDLVNWDINVYGGLDEAQNITIADSTLAQSKIFNSRAIVVLPTTDITTDYYYGFLDQADLSGTFDYNSYTHTETFVQQTGQSDILSDLVITFDRLHLGVGGASTSQNTVVKKDQVRLSGGHVSSNLTASYSEILMDGVTSVTGNAIGRDTSVYVGGTAANAYGIKSFNQNAGTTTNQYGIFSDLYTNVGATTNSATNLTLNQQGDIVTDYFASSMNSSGVIGNNQFFVNVNSGADVTNDEYFLNYFRGAPTGNNQYGLNLNFDNTAVSTTAVNINDQADVTGSQISINYGRNGTTGGSLTVFSTNFNNASAVTNDLKHINLNSDATVGGNGGFLNGVQNGDVTGGWNGVSQTIGADIGGGLNFHNDIINNSATVTGDIYGHAVTVDSSVTVTGRTRGWSLVNNAPAEGVEGFTVINSADLIDNFRAVYIGDTGDSRTKTAIDISLSGAVADDAQGLRVNVSGLVMASQRAVSGAFEGGAFNVQGQMTPFSGLGVDVGNNVTMTSTVQAGSPLTGTDHIIQLFQSNLIAQDDIATGPIGLNTNMYAFVSQTDVGSGKTIPLLRTMLLGTTVPSGSGGTITEHVVLDILGLPSFGGSVTCPTKVAIQDAALLGQNFSDGTTEAWFIRNNDLATQNHFGRIAIGTADKKVANSSIGLEMGGVTRVLRLNILTDIEEGALTGTQGMIYFNSTIGRPKFHDGVVWIAL